MEKWFDLYRSIVMPAHCDLYGHMNVRHYAAMFDDAGFHVLAQAGMTIEDVDVVELNEAFAAQVLPVCRELGIDPFGEQVNPHGGAIALGHPYGMTGARILCTLLNDLETLDGTIGLETMCVGGGQGMAMLVERLT